METETVCYQHSSKGDQIMTEFKFLGGLSFQGTIFLCFFFLTWNLFPLSLCSEKPACSASDSSELPAVFNSAISDLYYIHPIDGEHH